MSLWTRLIKGQTVEHLKNNPKAWPKNYIFRGYNYRLTGFRTVPFWNTYGHYSIVLGNEDPPPRFMKILIHPYFMTLTLENAKKFAAMSEQGD